MMGSKDREKELGDSCIVGVVHYIMRYVSIHKQKAEDFFLDFG